MEIKGDDGRIYIEIEAKTEHITNNAVLLDDGIWIPKSCLEDWPDIGQVGIVIIDKQFAIKKGIA